MLCSMNSGVTPFTFLSFILVVLNCFPGHVTAAVVTLRSIELYKTHEWITKPTVYFQCKGENKTDLPDVKKSKVEYTFKGEESWQPLTNFTSRKCKRCGLYEKDFLKHDVFDEWELCPSEFTAPDGIYTHQTGKEFNATFVCPECLDLVADHSAHPPPPPPSSDSEKKPGKKGLHIVIVLLICAAVITVITIGIVGGYKYWKKRKRQQEQARFLKLFEQHDDMDDDLGLEEML